MPSNVAHTLFATDSIEAAFPERSPLPDELRAPLTLGAQGPDIFFHSRRRRPVALGYGAILHRKGIGGFVARFVETARERPLMSVEGVYAAGVITHAVLDRALHPYINYRAGWVDPADPASSGRKQNHVFLERLLDTALLSERGFRSYPAFGFLSGIRLPGRQAWRITSRSRTALRYASRRAQNDAHLAKRIRNAYFDALQYYEQLEATDLRRLAALIDSESHVPKWLHALHPPAVPSGIDVLNRKRAPWAHPCDSTVRSDAPVLELWEKALDRSRRLLLCLGEAWHGKRPLRVPQPGSPGSPHATNAAGEAILPDTPLETAVGNHNLADGFRAPEPCRRRYADPFSLEDALRDVARQFHEAARQA